MIFEGMGLVFPKLKVTTCLYRPNHSVGRLRLSNSFTQRSDPRHQASTYFVGETNAVGFLVRVNGVFILVCLHSGAILQRASVRSERGDMTFPNSRQEGKLMLYEVNYASTKYESGR